jgi:hypothetical protein
MSPASPLIFATGLVGHRQAERLDEEFEVKVDTEVSFVKLVPLVGG